MRNVVWCLGAIAVAISPWACSSGSDSKSSQNQGDSGAIDLGGDASTIEVEAGTGPKPVDGGFPYDGGVLAADRFVTTVVNFSPGSCGGFGADGMPTVIEGPPVGGGDDEGSLDVVSLGGGGSITLSFAPNGIVDGTGPDFIVFENAFLTHPGDPTSVYAEVAEVSVSDDGTNWSTFPCAATAYPYGACAGWHPVLSSPDNGIDPADPSVAGGDAFDLKDVGALHAKYVRIVDKTSEECPTSGSKPTKNGFDLDAVVIVNADTP